MDANTVQLGEGDIVYLAADGRYTIYGRSAYDEAGPVELDETYAFSVIDGTPAWSSSNPDNPTYQLQSFSPLPKKGRR